MFLAVGGDFAKEYAEKLIEGVSLRSLIVDAIENGKAGIRGSGIPFSLSATFVKIFEILRRFHNLRFDSALWLLLRVVALC